MAYQSIWYFTDLPDKIIDSIEEDLTETFDYETRIVLNMVFDPH